MSRVAGEKTIAVTRGADSLLADGDVPGVPELSALLSDLLGGNKDGVSRIQCERLPSRHGRVFRLRSAASSPFRTLIAKRLEPDIARKVELLVKQWLPRAGLADGGPNLLGVAAARGGECTWHVYEDLGDCSLDPGATDRGRVAAAVSLIAAVHARFAASPLVAEWRLHGGDLGIHFFTSNVRDAIRALESLRPPGVEPSRDGCDLRDGLLERMRALHRSVRWRTEALADLAGPETLLHGDLWPTNTFVLPAGPGRHARLIDWDHAGAGPFSYDLSTFLMRFPANDRRWILEVYGAERNAAGWPLPSAEDCNVLFETAEYSRLANLIIWPALALWKERAEWGFEMLEDINGWFEEYEPVIPEKEEIPRGRQVSR